MGAFSHPERGTRNPFYRDLGVEISPQGQSQRVRHTDRESRNESRRVRHNSQSASLTVRSPLSPVTYLTLSDCEPPADISNNPAGVGDRVGHREGGSEGGAREKRVEDGKRRRRVRVAAGLSSLLFSSVRISERGFPFLIFTRLKSVRWGDRQTGGGGGEEERAQDITAAQLTLCSTKP